MPVDRLRYPADWEAISRRIRERAGGRCEWCHAAAAPPVVLTVHHADQDTGNNEPGNLVALCQRCHLRADHRMHIQHGRKTRMMRRAVGPLPGLEGE